MLPVAPREDDLPVLVPMKRIKISTDFLKLPGSHAFMLRVQIGSFGLGHLALDISDMLPTAPFKLCFASWRRTLDLRCETWLEPNET